MSAFELAAIWRLGLLGSPVRAASGVIVMKIRDFSEGDLAAVLTIQAQCRQAAQWRAKDYTRLVEDPSGLVLVAELDTVSEARSSDVGSVERVAAGVALSSMVAGFVAFHRTSEEAELRNLAVAPERQRCGIGRLLLQVGQQRLLEAGVKEVYLEVRPSNAPALSLYMSVGYKVDSVRKGYYRNPDENAQTLSLTLSRNAPS